MLVYQIRGRPLKPHFIHPRDFWFESYMHRPGSRRQERYHPRCFGEDAAASKKRQRQP